MTTTDLEAIVQICRLLIYIYSLNIISLLIILPVLIKLVDFTSNIPLLFKIIPLKYKTVQLIDLKWNKKKTWVPTVFQIIFLRTF